MLHVISAEKKGITPRHAQEKNDHEKVHTNINNGWGYDDDDDVEYTYHQTDNHQEWDDRIFINSESTIDIFKNK